MLPRPGPPEGAKQWTGGSRGGARTSERSPDSSETRSSEAPAHVAVATVSPIRPTPVSPASGSSPELSEFRVMVRMMHAALMNSGILKEQEREATIEADPRPKRPASEQLNPASKEVTA